jgi:hypothetical protein
MDTDTGGGGSGPSNSSKMVNYKPATSSASAKKTVTTSAKKSKNSTSGLTYTGSTKAPNLKRYVKAGSGARTYPSTASVSSSGKDYASKNWNNYLKVLNSTMDEETAAINQNASNYGAAANDVFSNAEATHLNAYNTNKSLYDQQAADNAKREAAANQYATDYYNRMLAINKQKEQETMQSIADYYNKMSATNKEKEKATLDAINNQYSKLMGNASEYYKNLINTYNRSMGYVDTGFNEGKQTTEQARDEAIALAQALYEMGEATQNRQTERDLRGQYTSYMQQMKNLNQKLAAQGINGGATETSLLGALNGYESNRSDLEEARLTALGGLRQQQMQSDSEAQQAYLNKLAEMIENRTNQQLGVETTRSQNEYNYENMKNTAETEKGNQSITAQNNFQNWANSLESNKANMTQTALNNIQSWANALENNYANMGITNQNNFQNWASTLTNQRAGNETTYANAIADIANQRSNASLQQASMSNQAAQAQADILTSQAYLTAVNEQSKKNKKAKVKKSKSSSKKSSSKKSSKKKKKK